MAETEKIRPSAVVEWCDYTIQSVARIFEMATFYGNRRHAIKLWQVSLPEKKFCHVCVRYVE